MRTVRLAKVAAQAEALRLRRIALRLVRRAGYGALAAVFALFALGFAHVLVLLALVEFAGMLPFWAALIVLGGDVAVALVFLLLASGRMPDRVEVEARTLRDNSLRELRNSAALGMAMGPAGRVAGRGVFGLGRRLLRRRRD